MVGHTTWDDYSKMTRMFKYYNFYLDGSDSNANRIAMSSYPGCVSSTDEFYTMDSGLVVADTSLEILNTNLYRRVKDAPGNTKIPNFVHLMIANRMSKTGNVQMYIVFFVVQCM